MARQHELFEGTTCQHCKTGKLRIPEDEHVSYCLCDTCGAIQLTYVPQTHQEEFHETKFLYNEDGSIKTQTLALFGGYGSAKSTASLWELFIRCLENPNSVTLITAPTLPLLKRTSIKTLLDEIIPPPLLERFNKSEMEFTLTNGHVIYAVASDEETKLRSLNIGQAHMEEASGIKRTIYDQILTRLRHHNMWNKCLIVSSNPDMNWIKDVLVNNDKRADPLHPEHEDYDDSITTFIWPTALNKYLPPDFAAKISKGKPEWWVKRFLEGSFDHSSGMVYPESARAIINDIPDFSTISKGWERGIMADFGIRNPTAVLFGAIDPKEGILYIYSEYYQANALLPQHAAAIKPMVNTAYDQGPVRFMVGDPAMQSRGADVMNGKNVMQLYQEYNLYFTPGNNNIDAGILRVNSYINRGKLRIFRSCVNLTREIVNYKYPELDMDDDKNLDEKPIKRNDHAVDALRYGCMRLPENPDDLVSQAYEMPTKYQKANNVTRDYDDDDEEEMYGNYLSYV